MTLKNAKRRFLELGCEVERDVAPFKYKWRPLGALAWNRGHCLYFMLAQAEASRHAKRAA